MNPLTIVTGPALSLPAADIDTDIIYPARFLLITERKGLGQYAFYDRRGDTGFPIEKGAETAPPILIAGPNFGSGSSREHAPWALDGLGVRIVISESFGEIFYGNCFKNGMLPIRLDSETVRQLHDKASAGAIFTVDLEAQRVQVDGCDPIPFEIAPVHRETLLNGWTEVTRILQFHSSDIASFEAAQRRSAPWLW